MSDINQETSEAEIVVDNQNQDVIDSKKAEAALGGWREKSEFKGKPEDWVDYNDFLDKGKHILPIVQKKNAALESKIQRQELELSRLKESTARVLELAEATKARELEALKAEISQMKAQRAEALTDGDGKLVSALEDAIDAKKEAIKAKAADPVKKQEALPPDPDFVDFQDKNKNWYGKDEVLTFWANKRGLELDREGKSLKDILEIIAEEVKVEFPNKFDKSDRQRPPAQRGGNTTQGARPNTFEAMPKEVQSQFLKDVAAFRITESQKAAYKETYVQNYFSQQGK